MRLVPGDFLDAFAQRVKVGRQVGRPRIGADFGADSRGVRDLKPDREQLPNTKSQ